MTYSPVWAVAGHVMLYDIVLWLLSDYRGVVWVGLKYSADDWVHFVKASHLKLPKLIRGWGD